MAAYEIEGWYAYDWSTAKYGIRSVDAGLGSQQVIGINSRQLFL